MPRKKSHEASHPPSPLFLFRRGAGLSQEALGRALRLSARAVRSAELGEPGFCGFIYDRLILLEMDEKVLAKLALLQSEWRAELRRESPDLEYLRKLYVALMPEILWHAHHAGVSIRDHGPLQEEPIGA